MKTAVNYELAPATAVDVPAIAALLREAGLSADDLGSHVNHFVIARSGGKVVGAIGAQLGGADALLRSLVVAPEHRGVGLGARLVTALERKAAGWGVRRWWLLTMTAEEFFARQGFQVASRTSVPPAIQRTTQFSGGCGGSAVCMTRERKAAS